MGFDSHRIELLHDLRSEIDLLKSCQTQTVTFGLTGAGVILGLTNASQMDCLFPFLFLMPLLALLPFWIIFFDKARTISRIVGFIRVQERLLKQQSNSEFMGWELAMKLYREKNIQISDDDIKKANESITETNKKTYNSVYWFTVYTVFFLFSTICLLLSLLMAYYTKNWILSMRDLGFILIYIFVSYLSLFLYSRFVFIKKPTMSFSSYPKEVFMLHILCILGALLLQLGLAITANTNMNVIIYLSTNIIGQLFIVIFWFFFFIFSFISHITLWEFRHLIRGRYTYNAFEKRWSKLFINLQKHQ